MADFIAADGCRIHYETFGETGPRLILIPGLLNDAGLWRDQLTGLAGLADCRVADITRGESMQALADSVLADAAPTFALAGFSLGVVTGLAVSVLLWWSGFCSRVPPRSAHSAIRSRRLSKKSVRR